MKTATAIKHIEKVLQQFSPGERFTSDMLKIILSIELSGPQIGSALRLIPNVRRVTQGHQPRGQSVWEVI